MPTQQNDSLDRWLRLAPWAAAILVALCILALVVRLALQATGGSDHIEQGTQMAQARSSDTATRGGGKTATTADTPIAPSATSSRPTAPADAGTFGAAAPNYTSTASGAVSSAKRRTKSAAAPDTPNSKSRLEIHGARGGSLLGQSDDSSTSNRPRSSDKSADAGSKAAASPDVLANRSQRATPNIGKAYTSVFGLDAEGSRFVYVFDRSGSMGEPDSKPLRAAKDELIKSLERLDSIHQFFLIFYNQSPTVFNAAGASGRLVFGTDLNKQSARSFIEQVPALGGTNHYEALLIAMKLHPDVIFLLTDGERKDDLTADELARLKRLNKVATRIYVIQFASSQYSSNSLVQLARENGGEHKYVDIRRHVAGAQGAAP